MNKWLAVGLGTAFAVGGCGSASAADTASQQANIAHIHALMAQNAKTVPAAHAHLHHVINCLVGPKGAGFDARAGDPCNGQGNGAISDAAKDKALQGKLRGALDDAQAGLKSESLPAVQADAGRAAAALGSMQPTHSGS